jgi:hypothetical protein
LHSVPIGAAIQPNELPINCYLEAIEFFVYKEYSVATQPHSKLEMMFFASKSDMYIRILNLEDMQII